MSDLTDRLREPLRTLAGDEEAAADLIERQQRIIERFLDAADWEMAEWIDEYEGWKGTLRDHLHTADVVTNLTADDLPLFRDLGIPEARRMSNSFAERRRMSDPTTCLWWNGDNGVTCADARCLAGDRTLCGLIQNEDDDPPTSTTEADDLLYRAWTVIANASDWLGEEHTPKEQEWIDAAVRWRDEWHRYLEVRRYPPKDVT